jgi:hypothetical protein
MRPKAAKAAERMGKAATNEKIHDTGKPKPNSKPAPAEKASRKQLVREARLRVTDADLAPGSLTSENS